MFLPNLPSSITNFQWETEAQDISKSAWLKITRITNVGNDTKEIKQKVIRLGPDDQAQLYEMLQEKFEGNQ